MLDKTVMLRPKPDHAKLVLHPFWRLRSEKLDKTVVLRDGSPGSRSTTGFFKTGSC